MDERSRATRIADFGADAVAVGNSGSSTRAALGVANSCAAENAATAGKDWQHGNVRLGARAIPPMWARRPPRASWTCTDI